MFIYPFKQTFKQGLVRWVSFLLLNKTFFLLSTHFSNFNGSISPKNYAGTFLNDGRCLPCIYVNGERFAKSSMISLSSSIADTFEGAWHIQVLGSVYQTVH